MRNILFFVVTGVLAGLLAAGCASDATDPSNVEAPFAPVVSSAKILPEFPPDPSGFVLEIDNPYLGFERGKTFRYEGETEDGLETIVVEVTNDTKTILGLATTVVRDRVYLEGDLIEDTFDWYAQDIDGNVWYFGEDSKEIENGVVVSTEGSWEAGVDGAMPGIIMLAEPVIGTTYQQEFAEDVAEDMAKVLSLTKEVGVPYGTFEGCLMTMEWSPLSPGAREFKYYAPGVRLVLEVQPRGGRVPVELIAIEN
jgi:hypothetical protein